MRTISLLIVLLIAPLAYAQTSGGGINNIAPTGTSFTGNVGTADNLSPTVETFSFTVSDDNGEADIAGVRITSTDATFGTQECTDIQATTTCLGWSFSGFNGDAALSGTYQYTWPAGNGPGTFTQTLGVKDEGTYQDYGTTDQTQITSQADITIAPGTYDDNGISTGNNWGQWAANPGASNVESVNWLKATNDGTATGQVTVSFTPTTFSGTTGSIGIDGNIKFRSGTGATPSTASPTAGSTDADGTESFTIAAGETLWIGYSIDSIPIPTPDEQYTASYTLTDTS